MKSLWRFFDNVAEDISDVFLSKQIKVLRHQGNFRRTDVGDVGAFILFLLLECSQGDRVFGFLGHDPEIILTFLRAEIHGEVIARGRSVWIERGAKEFRRGKNSAATQIGAEILALVQEFVTVGALMKKQFTTVVTIHRLIERR